MLKAEVDKMTMQQIKNVRTHVIKAIIKPRIFLKFCLQISCPFYPHSDLNKLIVFNNLWTA